MIHRTAALLASAEGRGAEPFRYREGMALGGGGGSLAVRWAIAGGISGIQFGLRGLARARPTVRRPIAGAMARIGPASGFGPAADRLEGWRWTMSLHARTRSDKELEVHLDADGHPGYLATARILGEAGMLLAEDGATPQRAGCLTPAVALGTACIGRFERAVERARLVRLHRILSPRLVNVFAVAASECPQIGTGTTGFDPVQHDAASVTLRAAGSFGHSQS